jgi:hypothetical protein
MRRLNHLHAKDSTAAQEKLREARLPDPTPEEFKGGGQNSRPFFLLIFSNSEGTRTTTSFGSFGVIRYDVGLIAATALAVFLSPSPNSIIY